MHYHWQKVIFFLILFPMLYPKEQNNHVTNVRTCSTSRSCYQKKYIWFLFPLATNKNTLPLAQEMLRLFVAQRPLNTTAVLKSPSQNTYQPWFWHMKYKTRYIQSWKIQQHLITHWPTYYSSWQKKRCWFMITSWYAYKTLVVKDWAVELKLWQNIWKYNCDIKREISLLLALWEYFSFH